MTAAEYGRDFSGNPGSLLEMWQLPSEAGSTEVDSEGQGQTPSARDYQSLKESYCSLR